MLGDMTRSTTTQTPRQHVTSEQRNRAEKWLQEAYADGRIGEDEFDRRIDQVISAATRRDLDEAFVGLGQATVPPIAFGADGADGSDEGPTRTKVRADTGRRVAALAHLSPLFSWLLGPLLVFALTEPGSYPRREAAKAFNFQLTSTVAGLGATVLAAFSRIWTRERLRLDRRNVWRRP